LPVLAKAVLLVSLEAGMRAMGGFLAGDSVVEVPGLSSLVRGLVSLV
jgi:hypothetical protein